MCVILGGYHFSVVLPLVFQGAEELDIGGGSRRRAKMEVAQMKEQLESQVRRQPSSFSIINFFIVFTKCD